MNLRFLLIAFSLIYSTHSGAQHFEYGEAPGTVKTRPFWSNWFLQMGLDMSLQNPYGYNFSRVFPNGKSFGLDLAVGKWFTPQVGYRGTFNWENALPLLKNGHANWLAPFYQPSVNRDEGGYIAFYADVLLNMHHLLGTYKQDRPWNLSLYPRAGVNYNFGVSKGSLLVGAGILNTYRLSNRWSIYMDAAYQMIGSGFVGSEKVEGTGTGSNSNGYFSLGLGAQVDLGTVHPSKTRRHPSAVFTNGFWDNWFLQAGIDMSLMNPYGCDFSSVFPKGKTFGLHAAIGKSFSPEFALRGRLQWENGLIENKHVEWVAPKDAPAQNYKEGGLGTASLDALLNLTNVIAGYQSDRKWHTAAFIRAGLISQFADHSASPLIGAGMEQTYRLTDKFSLYGSVAYQVITSEGMGVSTTGMNVAAGSNGFFDIDLGVVIQLGKNKFQKTAEKKKSVSSSSVENHNWSRFILNTAASAGIAWGAKSALKSLVKEERPDHSDDKSFPSGHTAIAFAGATSLHKEFGKEHPLISVAGFAAATAVGIERVANQRHHWYDVLAGAGIGYGSTELTWWLSQKLFKSEHVSMGLTGNSVDVSILW